MVSSSSSSPVVGFTEEILNALLEYLVDPMLPLKSSACEAPSISQQRSVAKQVHAVVLLYNYYQRKQHPEVEFLSFESFCKLAVILRPSLMAYMKFMHRSDSMELNDQEVQLSVAEKAIIGACNISLVLDAKKDFPNTAGWPISKVAVFLIDSRKENCLLLFSAVTDGVWSVIEKDLDFSNVSSESIVAGKHISKKKRISKKPLGEDQDADEASFQQLAFSAVKEKTGINEADLLVIESHTVYSLSKEKTAARFYVLQSTKSLNEDIQVPIKDAIESLQGPLVIKSSNSWTAAPVVEYFHVLPYAGIISDLFFREVFSSSFQDLRAGVENKDDSFGRMEDSCENRVSESKEVRSDTLPSSEMLLGRFTRPQTAEEPCDKEMCGSKDVLFTSSEGLNLGIGSVDNNSSQKTDKPFSKDVFEKTDTSYENCGNAVSVGNTASRVDGSQRMESSSDKEVIESIHTSDKNCGFADSSVKESNGAKIESLKNVDNSGCVIFLSNSASGPKNMGVDETSVVCPTKEDKSKKHIPVKVYHHQKKRTSKESGRNSLTMVKVKGDMPDSVMKPVVTECRDEKVNTGNNTCSTVSSDQIEMPLADRALVPFQPAEKHLQDIQITLAAKEDALSQTALEVLLRKREKLSDQLRNLQDEIAVCDKKIQTIMDGQEDGLAELALKLEVVLECCNDVCLEGKFQAHGTSQLAEDEGLQRYVKRRRLSEAIITLRAPCQIVSCLLGTMRGIHYAALSFFACRDHNFTQKELDDVCLENYWTLPTYNVSSSAGGFLANVTVKAFESECSCGGELEASPREARDSAASEMLVKLRNLAGKAL